MNMNLLSEFTKKKRRGRSQSPVTRKKISLALKNRKQEQDRQQPRTSVRIRETELRSKAFRNYVSPTASAVRELRGLINLGRDITGARYKGSNRKRRDGLETASRIKSLLR
jgi:hypothetical protein